MSEDVWSVDSMNDGSENDTSETNVPHVVINGDQIPVDEGDNFLETIKELSIDAGFGKFRVFLNGEEIKPSEAPVEIGADDVIEIQSYDVPA